MMTMTMIRELCSQSMHRGRGAAFMAAALVLTGCATANPAPGPDAAPEQMLPTLAHYDGWCYDVQVNGWSSALMAQAPELTDFDLPTVVYLHPDGDHGSLEGGIDTGSQELLWENAREARWIGEKGEYSNEAWAFGHAHWWRMDDARYHIGFSGDDRFWIGFEALPSDAGLDGVFRYWELDAMGEAGEAAEPAFEVSAALQLVNCTSTPMVIFDDQ